MQKTAENQVLAFYLGTRRIAAILAEKNPSGGIRVLRWIEQQGLVGFEKGTVVDLEKATSSLTALLKGLELGDEAFEIPVYVLLSGSSLKMSEFTSSIYFSGYPRVLSREDVNRVVEQTRNMAPLSLDDWILQVIPESFWVNDVTGVRNPLGLEAQRLAVTLQIFTIHHASFRNIAKVFESLEFNLEGYYPKTLVLSDGVLNEAERKEDALILDFSDDVTHVVLAREGRIVRTKSLKLGSRILSEQISEAWKVSLRDAERLKERFGSLAANSEFGEELIPLVERNGHPNHQIKRAEFHREFMRFSKELFEKILKEIEALLAEEKISHPHFILTGGGAKLEGLLEFLSSRISSPVRLGTPRQIEAPAELLVDPAWSGLVGLLSGIASGSTAKTDGLVRENLFERTFQRAKSWLTAYF